MLSFPFFAIQFCGSSEASVTDITNAIVQIVNSWAFKVSSFALQLVLVTILVKSRQFSTDGKKIISLERMCFVS